MKLPKQVYTLSIGLAFLAGAVLIVAGIAVPDGRLIAFGVAVILSAIVMIIAGAVSRPDGSLVSGGASAGASYKVTPDWAIVAAIALFVIAGALSATVLKKDAPPTSNPSKQAKTK